MARGQWRKKGLEARRPPPALNPCITIAIMTAGSRETTNLAVVPNSAEHKHTHTLLVIDVLPYGGAAIHPFCTVTCNLRRPQRILKHIASCSASATSPLRVPCFPPCFEIRLFLSLSAPSLRSTPVRGLGRLWRSRAQWAAQALIRPST